jgi:hypothetical protein
MTAARGATIVLLAVFCGALAGAPALAEDPKGKETADPAKEQKDGRKAGEEVRVYTNADLDRLPPDPTASRTVPKPEAAPDAKGADAAKLSPNAAEVDPLKKLDDDRSRAAGLAAQIAEAERTVAAAEGRVRALERRELAIKNPYLPRPEVPPEQAEAWKTMNGAERVQATEEEIKQAKKDVEDARAALEKLRAAAEVH